MAVSDFNVPLSDDRASVVNALDARKQTGSDKDEQTSVPRGVHILTCSPPGTYCILFMEWDIDTSSHPQIEYMLPMFHIFGRHKVSNSGYEVVGLYLFRKRSFSHEQYQKIISLGLDHNIVYYRYNPIHRSNITAVFSYS